MSSRTPLTNTVPNSSGNSIAPKYLMSSRRGPPAAYTEPGTILPESLQSIGYKSFDERLREVSAQYGYPATDVQNRFVVNLKTCVAIWQMRESANGFWKLGGCKLHRWVVSETLFS